MASQHDIEQLLIGILTCDIYHAFGVSRKPSKRDLESECRRVQKNFHTDRGNRTEVSQLANACAEVLTGKRPYLSECIKSVARCLFEEQHRTPSRTPRGMDQPGKHENDWQERRRKAVYAKVTSQENYRRLRVSLTPSKKSPVRKLLLSQLYVKCLCAVSAFLIFSAGGYPRK